MKMRRVEIEDQETAARAGDHDAEQRRLMVALQEVEDKQR